MDATHNHNATTSSHISNNQKIICSACVLSLFKPIKVKYYATRR